MGIHSLRKETFRGQIDQGITLVEFYDLSSKPCLEQLDTLEKLAQEARYQADVSKVDIHQERELAAEYGVSSVPTLMLFKDGYKVETWVGQQSKEVLQQHITSYATMGDSCV
ncbi:thioredoxin family protein [Paenibacillus sacheonensis]|uniref:Thioredoxin n=1 Tax=Paenibacillus sacheonensis TaxID=742054 RepID=A0A7X5C1J5_9BACL|nr:thioredoxin domain-containing protein [Paenibacillus sacheonensis]MBM7566138.1 thioredoxin 1 [Paenibacillus sacheonensis]NBC70350.1 thioredoxin [Paenibacillus sacheonensis]